MSNLIKNTAAQAIPLTLRRPDLSLIGTTVGVSVTVGLDTTTLTAGAGTLSYVSGQLYYTPTQAETNGNVLIVKATHAEAAADWVDSFTLLGSSAPTVEQIIAGLDSTAVPGTPTAGSYAERFSKIQTSGNVATTSDAQAGTASIPVNQVAVPDSRKWVLTSKGTALIGEKALRTYIAEPMLWAIDFRHDLPTNGTLANITDVEVISALDANGDAIVDGISFNTESAATFGVDKTESKFQITTVTAGTYVIEATVSYAAAVGGGSRKARVTLVVVG